MSPVLDAFLRSWPFDPWLLVALILPAWIYGRGWRTLRRRDPLRWHSGQLAAFVGGLSAIYLALASPVEPFSALLLQVHMVQHLLLMMVAPPLLWLGTPLFPLLRGLPRPIRTYWAIPLLRAPFLNRWFGRLTYPWVALALYTAMAWGWHSPAVYERALRSSGWHYLQHFCFLGSALLFWYPVVRPYPARPRWSAWLLFPYLILADVQNTVLSALFTFSSRVLYPYYAEGPRLAGVSVLEDQAAAGVLMWVPGSLVFLAPLFGIALRLLYGQETQASGAFTRPGVLASGACKRPGNEAPGRLHAPLARISLPLVAVASPPGPWDLLRVPLLGRFLRGRHARLVLQLPLALLAGLLIFDGLRGPQVGPMNLAGVLPWIHWRGLLILALLAAGNFFCLACPFLLPRTLARQFLPKGRTWPRWLRNKWLAVALLILFLWAYEAFSLWDSPWWTAWIVIGYFVMAFVVDGFFRGAAFCKYLCPIGQFNFVQSMVSPLEVRTRDPEVCARCATKDCIRGRPPHPTLSPSGGEGRVRGGIPGCELNLYQPRKAGNLDCTFCLDCVHACPHDNIGVLAGSPGKDLWNDGFHSGIGRLARRPDLAALVLVLVFGAYANAAGMIGPVMEWQDHLQVLLGQQSPLLTVTLFYVVALVVLPLLAVGTAAALSRGWGRLPGSKREVATRFSYALIPIGFGMWLAHYSFHFLTSYDTIVPTAQRLAWDLGWTALGEPAWVASCCRPVAEWLTRLEILFLDAGLLLSLYAAYRIALGQCAQSWQVRKVLIPWALLIVLLFVAGVWIVLQPMQMRGTLPG